MKLELITEADIPELIEMARQAHAESKYSHLPFSQPSVRATFEQHCGKPDCMAVKVVNETGIAGFFLATQTGFVFTETPIALETSYWVRPEARGTRCFLLMMGAFKDWADMTAMPQIVMPHFAEDNTKTYSALEKLGFREAGRIYTRGI